ncbi:MAG: rRNA maturation RNase YbeY [Candidatus Paceibacteria bacterium]
MSVEVRNFVRRRYFTSVFILRTADRILKLLGLKGRRLEIVLVGEKKMRALNKKFLKRAYPATILAFRANSDFVSYEPFLGEIYLCPKSIKKRATSRAGLSRELTILLIHGILHLVGEDHETPAGFLHMQRRERKILSKFFK